LFEEITLEETKSSVDKKRKSDRKSQPLATSNKEYFFPKYLTSKNLFDLEVFAID
jgi:hypothetical protein